jgi:hypothetical protein
MAVSSWRCGVALSGGAGARLALLLGLHLLDALQRVAGRKLVQLEVLGLVYVAGSFVV